jgi:K+-transporting ATPase c subunit
MLKKRSILLALTIIILAASCKTDHESPTGSSSVDSALFSPPRQSPYPPDGAVIGQGWDSFKERATQAQCVAVTEVAIESDSFDTDVEEIKSTFSLLKEQSMSASIGGSFGGFGASGSVSSSSSHKLETDFENVLFSFNASVGSSRAVGVGGQGEPFALSMLNSDTRKFIGQAQPASQALIFQALAQEPRPRRGSEVELTPAALGWLSGDISTFQRVCGDGFVSAIHRGTRVHVLATYQSRSEQEKSSFSASLAASGFGASASANMSSVMDQATLDKNTRYTISQQGGIPFGPPKSFDELAKMFTKTENFIERPAAFAVTLTPYSTVANYPSGVVLQSPERLKRLGDYYIVLSDLYGLSSDALEYALNSTLASPYDPQVVDAYGGVQHLRAIKDAIHSDLKMLEVGITDCYRNRSGCDEATVKKSFLKRSQDSAKELESSAATLASQNKTLNGFVSAGDKAGAAKALTSITGQTIAIDAVDKAIASFQQNLAQLNGQIRQLNTITGVLDNPEPTVSDAFFQRFYSFLIEIPLTKQQFNSDLKVGTDDTAINNVTKSLRDAILINRLMPWKQYFCKESMSANLCLYDQDLVNRVNAASLDLAQKAVKISIPQTVCHYYFRGGEISKQQYESLYNVTPFVGLFRRDLSVSCSVIYVPK